LLSPTDTDRVGLFHARIARPERKNTAKDKWPEKWNCHDKGRYCTPVWQVAHISINHQTQRIFGLHYPSLIFDKLGRPPGGITRKIALGKLRTDLFRRAPNRIEGFDALVPVDAMILESPC
jgi:hypothetical protein